MGSAVCHRDGCDRCMVFDWILGSRICYDCLQELKSRLVSSPIDLSNQEAVEQFFSNFMSSIKRDGKFPKREDLVDQLISNLLTSTDGE